MEVVTVIVDMTEYDMNIFLATPKMYNAECFNVSILMKD